MDRDDIELADAIEAIRLELLDASERGRGQAIQFEVGPVTLDFTVELKRDARAKGGIKAWVVSADAEAGVAQTRTHKVSVTLTPKAAATGGSVDISNDDLGSRDGF
ncbi:trypco2 family protein [Kitasatospora sp. NPDC059795]|uniref:trypco2 family protein n=1 Tax=Kitasatospora sp. NPDC059795 TaxID=3346949 RepID=UPI003646AF86